jgi:protein LTV1
MGVLPRRIAGDGTAVAAQANGGVSSGDEHESEAGTASAAAHLERRRGETAEERKARKAAVKEAQRAARAQKKELKNLFKEASVQAQRRAATAQPQAALKLPS